MKGKRSIWLDNGRSTREEWWIIHFVSYGALGFVLMIQRACQSDFPLYVLASVLVLLVGLLGFCLRVSVDVRRLHDMGLSGWYWYLSLVGPPIAGIIGEACFGEIGGACAWLALLVMYVLLMGCIDGTIGDNRYGPDPRKRERDEKNHCLE